MTDTPPAPGPTTNITITATLSYDMPQPVDVVLQIEAANTDRQTVVTAQIDLWGCGVACRVPAQDGVGERLLLQAEGRFDARYTATIALDPPPLDLSGLSTSAFDALPGEAIPYLLDSLYCPASRFRTLVQEDFGTTQGGARILALRDYVAAHMSYVPGASTSETTALDSFVSRHGVCRDFAHLLVTLARASDIPARFASVYAIGVEPQDFHAVAQVYLDGAWHTVDATGMARADQIAVIGIGRDAGDVAILTHFGPVMMIGQSVDVRLV